VTTETSTLVNVIFSPENDPIYRGCLPQTYRPMGNRAIALERNPDTQTFNTLTLVPGNNLAIPADIWDKAREKESVEKLVEAGAIVVLEQKDSSDSLKAFKPADQLQVVQSERSLDRLRSWRNSNPPAKISKAIDDRSNRLNMQVG